MLASARHATLYLLASSSHLTKVIYVSQRNVYNGPVTDIHIPRRNNL
jgi:hypothetical protein